MNSRQNTGILNFKMLFINAPSTLTLAKAQNCLVSYTVASTLTFTQ